MGAACSPEEWVEKHGDYLFNFACGQVRNATLAEDIVQETLLAAWRSRERFAGHSSERTWLTGILRHKVLDHLRRQSRTEADPLDCHGGGADELDGSIAWVHEVAAECTLPHRRLELDEFREALQRAMGSLPPRIAQAFQLYEIDECSNREVCEAMNISEANLWVMVHRARKMLREELANWWGKSARNKIQR